MPLDGSIGDCYDDTLAESLFATLVGELLAQRTLYTHDKARTALIDYLEVFYNRQRHGGIRRSAPCRPIPLIGGGL